MGSSLIERAMEEIHKEHQRLLEPLCEQEAYYEEELERLMNLFTTHLIPQEEMLHAMFDEVTEAYEQASEKLQMRLDAIEEQFYETRSAFVRRDEVFVNPLADVELEIERIRSLLDNPGLEEKEMERWRDLIVELRRRPVVLDDVSCTASCDDYGTDATRYNGYGGQGGDSFGISIGAEGPGVPGSGPPFANGTVDGQFQGYGYGYGYGYGGGDSCNAGIFWLPTEPTEQRPARLVPAPSKAPKIRFV